MQRSGGRTCHLGQPLTNMKAPDRPDLLETREMATGMDSAAGASQSGGLAWRPLPLAAKLYVAVVTVLGFSQFALLFPQTYPRPLLFGILLFTSCLTSAWKVNLPITLVSASHSRRRSYSRRRLSPTACGAAFRVFYIPASMPTPARQPCRSPPSPPPT